MQREPRFFGESLPYLKPFSLKGKLIVIEGTDGVGRSTQIALLKNWLEIQGYAVVETGWARSNLMHKSIEMAKSGNIMDRMTFTLLYATDFADRYENLIKASSLRMPLLVVHGERDDLVPATMGHAVLNAAHTVKEGLFLPQAGHNDLWEHGAGKRIIDFISRHAS